MRPERIRRIYEDWSEHFGVDMPDVEFNSLLPFGFHYVVKEVETPSGIQQVPVPERVRGQCSDGRIVLYGESPLLHTAAEEFMHYLLWFKFQLGGRRKHMLEVMALARKVLDMVKEELVLKDSTMEELTQLLKETTRALAIFVELIEGIGQGVP